MTNPNEKAILDWEELSKVDQTRAEELLKELNNLFDRNFRAKRDKDRVDRAGEAD